MKNFLELDWLPSVFDGSVAETFARAGCCGDRKSDMGGIISRAGALWRMESERGI